MRRFAYSVFSASGLVLLAACSGGSGLNTGGGSASIDSVAFTNGSGQVNDFFVAPGGTAPLQVNAQAIKGSGPAAVVVPDATFTWAAAYAPSGTTYVSGVSPAGPKFCGNPNALSPIGILQQTGTGTSTISGTFSALPAGQAAQTVFVQPNPAVVPVAPGTSYCIDLNAIHVGDGRVGNVLIVVSASP